MTDDGHSPTIPDTRAPTQGPSLSGTPNPPDARYALQAMLGKGGMGEVWLAHDLRIDRDIAIKLMRGGSSSDPDAIARFLREAKVQGRLDHPSVVPVHDLGGEQGSPYFAMKRLIGTTLADVLAAHDDAKWPRRTLLARFVDLCLAVEFAHQRGVIHRDLKPANMMLGDYGEAYILDWGLARIVDDTDSGMIRASDLRGDSGVGHTQAGAVLGTPGYMAPEQMRGEEIDQRADVFALGCILFEILAGVPAMPRDRAFEVTLATPSYRPAQCNHDVPPELDDTCARATAADPTARIASARALADEVQRFLDGDRDLERRRELAANHAKRAQELMAKVDHTSRAEAMREAGSAIALDPSNRDAQTVLARLLLEPPKTIPPEAQRKLDDERNDAIRFVIRGGAVVYLMFAVLAPCSHFFGVKGWWAMMSISLVNLLLAGLLGVAYLRRWRITRRLAISTIGLHAAMLAGVGVVLGPFLVLPVLVFGALPIALVMPTVRAPKTVAAMHIFAFAIPLVLELLRVVPASFSFVGDGMILKPWAVTFSPVALLIILPGIVVVQLLGNTFILDSQRRAQDRAQEQLHVQSWQLAQLVRSSGSTP